MDSTDSVLRRRLSALLSEVQDLENVQHDQECDRRHQAWEKLETERAQKLLEMQERSVHAAIRCNGLPR